MSKKYSSFKKQQLLTESWRGFLNEGEGIHGEISTVPGDAKPRFGSVIPQFASDVDKALYIVFNAMRKSKSEPEFLRWLSSLGYTQDQMMREGEAIKLELKQLIKSHPDFSGWGNTGGIEITLPPTAEEPEPDAGPPAPADISEDSGEFDPADCYDQRNIRSQEQYEFCNPKFEAQKEKK